MLCHEMNGKHVLCEKDNTHRMSSEMEKLEEYEAGKEMWQWRHPVLGSC